MRDSLPHSPARCEGKVVIRANVGKSVKELKDIVYIANSKFKSVTEANKAGNASSSSIAEHKV